MIVDYGEPFIINYSFRLGLRCRTAPACCLVFFSAQNFHSSCTASRFSC
ncbi:unnamed protein product [Rhodiola kirilowii]